MRIQCPWDNWLKKLSKTVFTFSALMARVLYLLTARNPWKLILQRAMRRVWVQCGVQTFGGETKLTRGLYCDSYLRRYKVKIDLISVLSFRWGPYVNEISWFWGIYTFSICYPAVLYLIVIVFLYEIRWNETKKIMSWQYYLTERKKRSTRALCKSPGAVLMLPLTLLNEALVHSSVMQWSFFFHPIWDYHII